jgi:hypothetical protein
VYLAAIQAAPTPDSATIATTLEELVSTLKKDPNKKRDPIGRFIATCQHILEDIETVEVIKFVMTRCSTTTSHASAQNGPSLFLRGLCTLVQNKVFESLIRDEDKIKIFYIKVCTLLGGIHTPPGLALLAEVHRYLLQPTLRGTAARQSISESAQTTANIASAHRAPPSCAPNEAVASFTMDITQIRLVAALNTALTK